MSDTITDATLDTASFLDQAFKVSQKPDPSPAPPADPPAPGKTADTVVAAGDPAPTPSPVVPDPASAPVAPKVAAVPAPDPGAVSDPLDTVQLGPHARPATAESFAKLKQIARDEVKRREEQIAELQRKAAEIEEKLKLAPAPEALTELEDLRRWRESVAVEADPVFARKFDEPIAKIDEAIFSKLKEHGATDEIIAEIKKLGGIENVDIEGLTKDPRIRRFIEAKIVQKEELIEQRKQAASAGQENRQKWLAEERARRQSEEANAATQRAALFDGMVSRFDSFRPLDVPKDADEATRRQIEAANKYVADQIATARSLVSMELGPQQQAELAIGFALAHLYQSEKEGLVREVTAKDKQIADLQKKIDAFEAASRTLRTERTVVTPPKPVTTELKSADEAMDEHFRNRR